jgi:hypothetical protein
LMSALSVMDASSQSYACVYVIAKPGSEEERKVCCSCCMLSKEGCYKQAQLRRRVL